MSTQTSTGVGVHLRDTDVYGSINSVQVILSTGQGRGLVTEDTRD